MARSMESIKAEAEFVARQDFEELMAERPSFNDLLDYLTEIAAVREDMYFPELLENKVKHEIKRRAGFPS